jgi:hypothetical protein
MEEKLPNRPQGRVIGLALGVFLAVCLVRPAGAVLYWAANTNESVSANFEGLEEAPGTIVYTNDPLNQQGVVFNYNTWDDTNYAKERIESRGNKTPTNNFRVQYTNDYYIGWKAMWNPMPINGDWVALFQMHGYGVTGQGAPLVLRCVNGDGNLYMQNGANGVDTNFWHVPFKTGVWQNFVLHIFLSTNFTQGYTEIWYNGVMQTFNNGQTRWYGPTWDDVDGVWADSYNLFKWGCYRSGSVNGKGPASAYMCDAKIGSAYADVDPTGGGSFTMSTAPTSQLATPGASTNYTVTVSALNGFNSNVVFSASGLPTGASAGFNPPSVTGSGSTTMTVTIGGSTPIGTYPISVFGTSGGFSQTNTVTLVVSSFTLSASPALATVNAGGGTNYTVTLATNGSFAGTVTLGLDGLPSGATAGFNPTSLSQSGTSTLTISTTSNTAGGNYALTIFGTNGAFVASTTANLAINGVQANPGALVWTAGSGGDVTWGSSLNWTNITGGGFGPPGSANSTTFTNFGATNGSALSSPGSGVVVPAKINSFENSSVSVGALTNYANSASTSPVYQNIGIASGATLTAGQVQVGGYGAYDFGGNNSVNTTISGAGATLAVNGGAVIVCQGSGSSGTHDASLDLSGLDNFTMNGAQIKQGVENMTRSGGILYLAKTNVITLTDAGYVNTDGSGSPYSGNPAIYLGHNKSDFGNGAQLYLGISNSISVDYVTVGRGDVNDLMAFNPAFLGSNPSVVIQGLGGAGTRTGVYVVGDNSPGEQLSSSSTNDFSGGSVNALVNYLCVGRGREGASDTTTATGTLTFNNGTINANTLVEGFMYPNGSNSFANGIVNVNGGATLTVVSNVTLTSRPAVGGTGSVTATLNVNGGTVQATNISGGGGAASINVNGGVMDLQAGNPFPGTIAGVSSLAVGMAGGADPAVLENATSVSVSNTITIATNGTMSGATVINAPGLVVDGTLSPGVSGAGGMTNNGPATFAAGSTLAVAVENAAGGSGTGWSFLQENGALNIQATAANPLTVSLRPVGELITNFTYATNYTWAIATASGGFPGYAVSNVAADSSQVVNDLAGGYFHLLTNGNTMFMCFSNNHPPAAGTVWLYRTGPNMTIPLSTLSPKWSDPDGDPVALLSVNGSTNGAGVGTDGTFIYYTNADDTADEILYTVEDIRTSPPAVYVPGDTQLTGNGTIVLLPPPSISSVSLSGGTLGLSGTGGVPGADYRVLSSTDPALPLNQWTVIATNMMDSNGNFNFSTPPPPSQPQTFYTLRVQ